MSSPGQSTAVTSENPGHHRMSRYLLAIGGVVMLAGLLFGYDQGVISGALDGIKKSFHPSTFVVEIITSWVTLGAMGGALAAGALTERLGRRFTILLSAAIFVAGALLESLAPGTFVLVVGRLVLGVGVGIASVAAPLYGAENARPSYAVVSSRCIRWRSRSGSSWPTSLTIC
jgi:MFS transporter, SP family, galactose:H+ symporter